MGAFWGGEKGKSREETDSTYLTEEKKKKEKKKKKKKKKKQDLFSLLKEGGRLQSHSALRARERKGANRRPP